MTKEQEFAMRWFRDYYSRTDIPMPQDHTQREFGFMFFDKDFVRRHMGFPRAEDFHNYLVRQVPMHVYYSSARYEEPSAPKMEQKGWTGADLVFDLDADHIKGADQMTYEEMLRLVKKDMVRLLDDFLFGDLGLSEDEVKVVFSGGRGYHAHVSNEKVLSLKSHERSEIVDYVSGTDIDFDWIFQKKTSLIRDFKSHKKAESTVLIPEVGSGGWKGHARKCLEDLLDEFQGMTPAEARQKYPALATVKDPAIESWQRELYGDRGGDMRGRELVLKNNSLAILTDKYRDEFVAWICAEIKPRSAAEVDEPVTRDIKRLIRMPGSLHGKTGMRVIPMSRERLDEFEPLRDAFPTIFPDNPMKIAVQRPVDITLKGQRFRGEGVLEVPTYAAIFMVLRMKASVL